ncbi:hypothetical protein E0K89_022430, partial [Aquicoccus sp. SCR17]|nr:hypothetical protein [Carideicomes alvinocaridis]
LAAAARRAGLRVSQAAIAPVLTSWRLVGRARGGHAETLAQRLSTADPYCDDRILPLAGLRERAERIGRPEMVEAGGSGYAGGAGQGLGTAHGIEAGTGPAIEGGQGLSLGAANGAGTLPWPPTPWPDPLPAVTLRPLAHPDPDLPDPDQPTLPALRMSEVQAMLPALRQLAGERPPPGLKGEPRQ